MRRSKSSSSRSSDYSRDSSEDYVPEKEQKKVRPTPTWPLRFVRVGTQVETIRGPGKVVDVMLVVGKFAETAAEEGERLMPPLVIVELDEPWDGETRVNTFLHRCKLNGKAVFRKPVHELWPDQVLDKPSVMLRPTPEPEPEQD